MKHYHKNPRQITKKQMSDLQKWLVEFGDLSGIVHNIPTDEIIGGNQRSEALPGVISGLIQPVITERYDPPLPDGTVCNGYYDIEGRRYAYRGVNWDEKKAERANLIANKAGGTFDMDILANQFDLPVLLDSGFEERELIGFDFGEPKDAEPQIDRAAELLKKWQVKTGDLWQIGEHRLICGDCTDAAVVARVVSGDKIDMVLTDPPYGVDYEYSDHKDDPKEYEKLANGFWASCPDAPLKMLTVGYKWNNFWFDKKPQGFLIWFDKTKQSPSNVAYLCKSELILIFGKVYDRFAWDTIEIEQPRNDGLRELHTCPKPLELWQKIIDVQKNAMVIFEPFSGSGTTLVACQNLNRRGRAIEISPAYCAVTLERMATAFPDLLIQRIPNDAQD